MITWQSRKFLQIVWMIKQRLSVVKSATQTSVKLDHCGTPQYMAPESFGLAPVFSTKSDVYAFAIVLWELG